MEMNLRHYLINWLNDRGFEALDELAQYDIRVGRDERYPNLFNLKYGSVMADKSSPLVRACRGAVVERVDNDSDHSPYYRMVAYAFDRFFNVGEGGCHELDWSRTKVFEKYDGSLIKLFNYNGDWIVSTSGSVAAASDVGSTGRSFAELFWLVFNEVGYSKEWLDEDLCYVFELCHKDNRIVVEYAEPQLPLLAVRDRTQDFNELDLESFCEASGFKAIEFYDFGSLEAVMSVVNNRGADHEGFILFDGVGRAKVKSDLYVHLHRVRGNKDPEFAELYLNDDLSEFLLHFPEYSEKFNKLVEKLDVMASFVESFVGFHKGLTQKEYANIVFKEAPRLSSAMFAIRSGKAKNFPQFLEKLTPKSLNELLDSF